MGAGERTTQARDAQLFAPQGSRTSDTSENPPRTTSASFHSSLRQTDSQTKECNLQANLEIEIPAPDEIHPISGKEASSGSVVSGHSDIRSRSTNILEARLPPDGHEHPDTFVNSDSLSRKKRQTQTGSHNQSQRAGDVGGASDTRPAASVDRAAPAPAAALPSPPGRSVFYPAAKPASPSTHASMESEDVPPSLPPGPPPPIPTEDPSELKPASIFGNAETGKTGSLLELDFSTWGTDFTNSRQPEIASVPSAADPSIRSYVESIVTTAVSLAKESSATNTVVSSPQTMTQTRKSATLPLQTDLHRSAVSNMDADTVRQNGLTTSLVPHSSDTGSSSGAPPLSSSALLTSPRSYSGSRPSSRRSSLGSDAGSVSSDFSMRGAAPPLKPARRESVIEALEKKRRESLGPKFKGLQLPSRRASTGNQSVGPMKALPTIAGLPAIGESKGFGVKPFRSVQPFSARKYEGERSNTAEFPQKSTPLSIQEPRQRWSFAGTGTDSVFDSPDVVAATSHETNPLASRTRGAESVKPAASPRSFTKLENRPERVQASQLSSDKLDTQESKWGDRPTSPKSPPPLAPKPANRKAAPVELLSKQTDLKQKYAPTKTSPALAPPKPTARESKPAVAAKPSLPPKPRIQPKPKKLSTPPVTSPASGSSPTSPKSVSEDEIVAVSSERVKPLLPAFPKRPPETTSRMQDSPGPKSPTHVWNHDLQVLTDGQHSAPAQPMKSPGSPVVEHEIQAIISSRTVRTETTVTFFPTSPKPAAKSATTTRNETDGKDILSVSPRVRSPVKVTESREIIQVRSDWSSADQEQQGRRETVRSPVTSPSTQGPIPFKRIGASSSYEDTRDSAAPLSPKSPDVQYPTFSLHLNTTSLRQGPRPFASLSEQIVGDENSDIRSGDDTTRQRSSVDALLISTDHGDGDGPPPLPGSLPPVPGTAHLLDDDAGQLSPAESGIRMDGSASDSATLESQSIDSLEDGLDFISSIPSSSNHSKTESEISITPSLDSTKSDSPASSTHTLIQMNGHGSDVQTSKTSLKGADAEVISKGRSSILSSPDGPALSPSPTPSDADSGIGSNRGDMHKSDKGEKGELFCWYIVGLVFEPDCFSATTHRNKLDSRLWKNCPLFLGTVWFLALW